MSAIDLNCRPALADHVRLQIDPVTDDPILLFPEGVLVLNPTAHDIVLHCNGKLKVREIVATLGDDYEIDEATLLTDAVDCLTDLLARNLIVVTS
jgi:pyrroloquinoline quinone biosynthesis protein D